MAPAVSCNFRHMRGASKRKVSVDTGHADRHWHPGEGRIVWRPVFDSVAS